MPPRLTDDVRAHAREVMASARSVRIDDDRLRALDVGAASGPDTADVPAERESELATGLFVLGAVNFGSGWFPTLRKRTEVGGDGVPRPMSGYWTVATALRERFAAHGVWSPAELRAMRADELADVLGQPRDHELVGLYAQALRALGAWLAGRPDGALGVVREAGSSAEALAAQLARLPTWADVGFLKRAQLLAADVHGAGLARFTDLERLTIFADNLIPHVLRVDGVLVLDERLEAWIDAGNLLRPGPQERELRAAAVVACEALSRRVGSTERELDAWLWTRGAQARYKARPRPRCRCLWY